MKKLDFCVKLFAPALRLTLFLVLGLALTIPVSAAAQQAASNQRPVTLRLTSAYMDRHPAYLGAFVPWMQELEAASQGLLSVRYFNPNTLCPEAEMFDALSAGVTDLAANAHGRSPGRFPLVGVMDLPMLFPDSATGSTVFQEIYEKYPELQAETAQVQILWNYVSAPHILHTTKPVTSLEDLQNMKIIAWAPLAVDVLRQLGASPIQAVPHDSYLAVQRGMADGVLCPLSTLRSFKINEAVSHTTNVALLVDGFWFGMAPDRWNSLDPQLQAIVREVSASMPLRTGQALDDGAKAESLLLLEEGHTFHELDEAELVRWQQALEPLSQKWLTDMEARGQGELARNMLRDTQSLLARQSQ